MVSYLVLIFLSDNTSNLDKVNLRIYMYIWYSLKRGWFDMGSTTLKVPVTRSLRTTILSSTYSQDDDLSFWTISLLNNDQVLFQISECRYHHGWVYKCTCSYVEVGTFQITESEGLD